MADAGFSGLPPGSTIGILGGGQLGRMLSLAASRLGFRTHIFCPDPEGPAFQVTDRQTIAAYGDEAALAAFADSVDIVTYEFENVPAETASLLLSRVPVAPNPSVLETTQDRYREKSFIRSLGFPIADFEPVSSVEDIQGAARRLGYPCVLKTRRLGYDGKGQSIISHASEAAAAWSLIGGSQSILEPHVRFAREISLIAGRGRDRTFRSFDIPENYHENGILRTSTVPARIGVKTAEAARLMTQAIAQAFSYVGVLAVEMFVLGNGADEQLLINEIAPRVHNSGHWTQDACQVSQFELHIRAIAGWSLPVPNRHSDVEMVNLLGPEALDYQKLAALPDAVLHLYGKSDARPGRKMGHVNRLRPLAR
jgi:5-(carboxyamino)imidazole ribonucleotide synthase